MDVIVLGLMFLSSTIWLGLLFFRGQFWRTDQQLEVTETQLQSLPLSCCQILTVTWITALRPEI